MITHSPNKRFFTAPRHDNHDFGHVLDSLEKSHCQTRRTGPWSIARTTRRCFLGTTFGAVYTSYYTHADSPTGPDFEFANRPNLELCDKRMARSPVMGESGPREIKSCRCRTSQYLVLLTVNSDSMLFQTSKGNSSQLHVSTTALRTESLIKLVS
jgi:hypothetical protein